MNADQVAALRELLGPSSWLDRTRSFARALRGSARTPGGLLVVGTPAEEPWHLAAHLDQEAGLAGLAGLAPTLVRWNPPPGSPPHLSVGLSRLEAARRGETLFVVSPDGAPAPLLERVQDARKLGATVLALDQEDPELDQLAHEALAITPRQAPFSFDAAQHLVSMAAGEPQRPGAPGLRGRLARLLDAVSGTSPR
ncbi:MAG TPA: hypothetical protein VH637_08840 [Streptosporangiaceae bacterium]|jgi:hypothetical protein